jgi:peptidoglycan/xylan/chitin deacetylase (PgdA/CDA1 family)
MNFVDGTGGLPRRPVLLTFDDAYSSVLEHALPALAEFGAPAVVFAVSGRVGGANDWRHSPEVPQLSLLDVGGLLTLATANVEIGAHTRTHPRLPRLSAAQVDDEVRGSREELRAMGVGGVGLFAYPYGESDECARRVVQSAGFRAAFTVTPGFVRAGDDSYSIPRIEILRKDAGWRFRWKVAVAGPLRLEHERWPVLLRGAWKRWIGPRVTTAKRHLSDLADPVSHLGLPGHQDGRVLGPGGGRRTGEPVRDRRG